MIRVEALYKSYGDLEALKGISFEAAKGRIFGLLGPNGAGKSTSIQCLSGLLRPTSGKVSIGGYDMAREPLSAKAILGIVPQELAIYENLSARDNLKFWGAAYGLSGAHLKDRVAAVLDRIGLTDRASELTKGYSGGMKRRLNFGCGIVHEPKVLLLDEPTVGVDPQSRQRMFDLVKEEREKGACILYTTHYMEEAESLCDELAIIDHGTVIAQGTVDELRRAVGERDIIHLSGVFETDRINAALGGFRSPAGDVAELLASHPDSITLAIKGGTQALSSLLIEVADTGAEIRETRLNEANLESLFLKLIGKELRA